MNSALLGLLGELKTLSRIQSNSADLHLRYVSNFPMKSRDTYYQVDAVVVCTSGVFCLEVKNWSCTVMCSDSFYWKVRYPTQEIVVKSPVKQNAAHCTLISKLLGTPVNNIVLFAGDTRLVNPLGGVMMVSDFIPMIRAREASLEISQIDNVIEQLKAYKKSVEPDMLVDFVFKQFNKR